MRWIDPPSGNLLALGASLLRAMASAWLGGLGLLPLTEAASPRPKAREAYFDGQHHLARQTPQDLLLAIDHFNRAVALEPRYARAYAGLADAHALLYQYPQAKDAALEALEIDDTLAEAHASLAFVRLHSDWDWAGAEEGFRRALDLDPDYARAHRWFAICLEILGRTEEAIAEAQRARDLAPGEVSSRTNLGYRLFWGRRYEEAITQLRSALELDPRASSAHYFIGRAYGELGRFEEAREAFAEAMGLTPDNTNIRAALAFLDARSGRRSRARAVLSELEELVRRGYPFATYVASVHAALGSKKEALDWLEDAYRSREGPLVWLKVDPRFDLVRSDPRFRDLLQRMGLQD